MPKSQRPQQTLPDGESRLPIAASLRITGLVGKPLLPQAVQPDQGHSASHRPTPIGEKLVELILARSKGVNLPDAFGGHDNVDAIGFESLLPSLSKGTIPDGQPRISVGSGQCTQPYAASLLNGSALSFGPMGKKFILAINRAASTQGFYQNTGEAGLSPYHLGLDIDIESNGFDANQFFPRLREADLRGTGDIVWQLGNGYFGCRKPNGEFDPDQFRTKALLDPVKMIEVKLSQGVEPLAKMPVAAVTHGMAQIMGLQDASLATLQRCHKSFSNPMELLQFVFRLRELSGGKPVGIKLGVSHRHYILSLCKAMRKSGILVDFITVDGMEAGTAAAQGGTLGFTGTALQDAVLYVHNALTGCRIRDEIRIIASGQVFTEKDMVILLARGADLFATARGLMLAVGCDQQMECYKGTCPKGIATQDPQLLKNFQMEANISHIVNYHQLTIDSLKNLVSMLGLTHPSGLRPFHMQKRVNYGELLPLDEVYTFLKPGVLLVWLPWLLPKSFRRAWKQADPFLPF